MRKCHRVIDKPMFLFGLEMEDIAVLSLMVGLGSICIGPTIPGVLGIIGWVALTYFKRDKPQGYLIHWIYSKGFHFPGLIVPLSKADHYCVCKGQ